MNNNQKKQKLLSKYLLPISSKQKNNAQNISQQNLYIRDQDQILADILSSSSSDLDEPLQKRRARVDSSGDDDQDIVRNNRKNQQELQAKKDRKLKKKLRKALGMGKDDEVQEFFENLQVEGIDKSQILKYLKQNKEAIIKREEQKPQKKKKKEKQTKTSEKSNKFEIFQKQSSSDLEIPQESRTKTIYRNKDGTIRDTSEKEQKEQHKKKVLERLSEWQKGMKKNQQDHEQDQNQHEDVLYAQNNRIWNDPMSRWEVKKSQNLLVCKYEGPPNRYEIKPGFRWDGVVRGNGFQNRYLQEINLKRAQKDKQHMEYMKDL